MSNQIRVLFAALRPCHYCSVSLRDRHCDPFPVGRVFATSVMVVVMSWMIMTVSLYLDPFFKLAVFSFQRLISDGTAEMKAEVLGRHGHLDVLIRSIQRKNN